MPRQKKSAPTDKWAELRAEARKVLLAALDLEAEPVPSEAALQAERLFYETAELSREDAVIRRVIKAVRTNPNNPDSLSFLVGWVESSLEGQIALQERVVKAGERDLGKRAFQELAGHFWGYLETRPYMRALHLLGQLYQDAGQFPKAIQVFERMLALNPTDNQGVRYSLMGLYLAENRLAEARSLWKKYEKDRSAFWTWGKVLLEFLSGKLEEAQKALREARQVNPHAEAYLGGWKPQPKELPDYYIPGEESEAIICLLEIGPAWMKHPEALRWLEQQP